MNIERGVSRVGISAPCHSPGDLGRGLEGAGRGRSWVSLKGTAQVFYKGAAPSCISTRTIGGIQFLCIPQDLVLSHFFVLAVLIGM